MDGDTVGSLVLQVNPKQIMAILERSLWILSGALLLVLVLSYPFSAFLGRHLTQPINALGQLMAKITEQQEYCSRADEVGPEEIQLLSRSFNKMLKQIQLRERALEMHKQDLENQVAQRTADLELKQKELEQLARRWFDEPVQPALFRRTGYPRACTRRTS